MNGKTDFRSLYDRDYIGSFDLPEGRDLTLTVKRVVGGDLVAMGGRKSKKPIVHFHEDVKPLICNKTNGKTIAALYTNYVQDWVGKRITLFVSVTRNPDGTGDVPCIRIRPQIPQGKAREQEPPPFDDAKESAAAAPGLPTAPSQEDAGTQPVADLITADQAIDIGDKLSEAGIAKERFLKATKVASIGMLPAAAYARAVDWIDKARSTK